MIPVVMTWQAASTFGWGILGLNVFCHWAVDPDITPLMVAPISPVDLRWLDPLRLAAIRDAVAASNDFAAKVAQTRSDDTLKMDGPVIDGLGNGFAPNRFVGTVNLGRLIFEDTRFDGFACQNQPVRRTRRGVRVGSRISCAPTPVNPCTSFTKASTRRCFVRARARAC